MPTSLVALTVWILKGSALSSGSTGPTIMICGYVKLPWNSDPPFLLRDFSAAGSEHE